MVEYNAVYADLTALQKNISTAGKRSGPAMQDMLEKSGEQIAAMMRALVPVKTGRLQGDIRVVKYSMKVVVGPTTVPYAAFVEFGTGQRGELYNRAYLVSNRGQVVVIDPKKAKKLRGQRAQPYARPAAREYFNTLGPQAAQIGVEMVVGERGLSK